MEIPDAKLNFVALSSVGMEIPVFLLMSLSFCKVGIEIASVPETAIRVGMEIPVRFAIVASLCRVGIEMPVRFEISE